MTTNRKPGQRKSNYDDESTITLLKRSKQQFAMSWGGKDPIEQIIKKLDKRGVKCGTKSATALFEVIREHVAERRAEYCELIDTLIARLQDEGKVDIDA